MVFMVIGVAVFIALIVVLIVFSAKQQAKRRAELTQFAEGHGFQTYLGQGFDGPYAQLLMMFQDFVPFGVGESRRAYDLVVGDFGGRTHYFFDYEYVTQSTSTDADGSVQTNRSTHRFGVVAVRVPLAFKNLEIRHEGFLDKIGEALGFKAVKFEMDEFNRRYHVKCKDEKFAFDVIHPGMIEYLLKVPQRYWQLRECYLLVQKPGSYRVDEMEEMLAAMQGFLDLIPEYVQQDIGFKPTWTTPFG
jgi:hypothetical protein